MNVGLSAIQATENFKGGLKNNLLVVQTVVTWACYMDTSIMSVLVK